MPIEMPRGLPFSVDTWSPTSKRKRHYFLTHAHKDHCSGILAHSSYPIYATHLTKSLLLLYFPQLEDSLFVGIEVGQSLVIDDPYGNFSVTAFDANHCPGAVMFLFEGSFGNILHTGDCRLSPECIQCLPKKYISKNGKEPRCQLDYVFLDCTFGRFHQKLPSKHSASQQVINCIWKHPAAAIVYLTCDLLGQEELLANVSRTFGSKIYVEKAANPECFHALTLTVPQILTQDPSSRFHVFNGFPMLYERAAAKVAEAQASFQPEPLIIRPSAQWYACEEEESGTESRRKLRLSEAVRDQFGIWHVCYSMHSSREELEWFLQLLAPKWVVSTTPPCRATELEYIRKHSFGNQLTSDDPIWKLLDISVEASPKAGLSARGIGCSPAGKEPKQTSVESQLPPVKVSSSLLMSLSPPSKRPAVTLFGRARLWIQDSNFLSEEKLAIPTDQVIANEVDREVGVVEDTIMKCENKLECNSGIHVAGHCEKFVKKEPHKIVSSSTIRSSRNSSETLRKLYRSMNVPLPRPLPSLVDLKDADKRNKRRMGF
ncbi:5' exonuclease Apollo isoform X1 [Ricinus communis]|uniref:5' exonuclease Apollo isoform X1 n=1 Tax=Ricinus communis TaxID=3988 RepID=UPI00201A236C|nr:5' exonuclease Apollo isoform X1 [Ricinus communis]